MASRHTHRALIVPCDAPAGGVAIDAGTGRVRVLVRAALLFGLTVAVYWPTVHNGFLFLAFDDAIITDTEALHSISWSNLAELATKFNQAHYVPATMLSLSLDHHFWGLDPYGYHLTNIGLHGAAAVLLYAVLLRLLGATYALVAALVFAVHPVQMEAVSLAVQRKTVLSGAAFFLALLLYQRWRHDGHRGSYVASLLAFALAALAKPIVVTMPLLLVLYDYVFVDGRMRWWDKLPYALIVAPVIAATVAAHAVIGALHPFHGGSLPAHLLMMGRVTLEQVTALFLPLNLSPIYYYPRAMIYQPLNFAAVLLIVSLCTYVSVRLRRYPWSFFCLGWFVLALAPESNVVALAQLRADRFLYLPLVGFAVWVAATLRHIEASAGSGGWRRRLAPGVGLVFVAAYACLTRASAATWHDNVSAWSRVVERHPWSGLASHMLGIAYFDGGQAGPAAAAFTQAARLDTGFADPHLYLARLYARQGARRRAESEVERFLELKPGDEEGMALRERIRNGEGG